MNHGGMLLIVPSDPMRPRRPDAHFADEADAARSAGWDVALIDHDALTQGESPVGRIPASEAAVYRGWMLESDQYAHFARALTARNTRLVTTPAQYRRAHELPGWYAALAAFTPQSTWTSGFGREHFENCCRELGSGPAVLKDFTKSMKHYWDEATYVPDVADLDKAWLVASRFLELRDGAIGGFVLRRFETFLSAEARSWWIDGQPVLVTAHPDTAQLRPDLDAGRLTALTPVVKGLGLPFVSIDLALTPDGNWRVIELGDGQVSDRPQSTPAEEFVAALARWVNSEGGSPWSGLRGSGARLG